ncbi:tyrosine-protein kinase Btk-like [Liolophura sinensis]|uniref:tyrosine-protein kinase Btk-like n=1 Tax=Liolophura sinensis TaxID=3198878 RepID=UPI0031586266
MAAGGENCIKLTFMQKKSQNKRTITAQNLKYRWFGLYPDALRYFDGTPSKNLKEKGFVHLNQIKVVADVEDKALDNKDNVFQVVYKEGPETRVLYIIANTKLEKDEWIKALNKECVKRGCVYHTHYHTGAWTKATGKFSCCGREGREAEGCTQFIFDTERNSDADMPAQGTPSSPYPGENGSATVAPQLPSSKPSNKSDIKLFVAIYDFAGLEQGDLQLKKDREYEILDDSNEHWWLAKDVLTGKTGYIPSNYVKQKNDLQTHEWYQSDMSRSRCEEILRKDGRIGVFLIRDSVSQPGLYTLSLFTGEPGILVRHYHIKKSDGKYFIADKHLFSTIPDLVFYHSRNAGGLAQRTRYSPKHTKNLPATAGLGHDKWEVDPSELEILDLLGSGHFGSVHRAVWKRSHQVAVKLMREGTMSEENFIDEAKTMKQLQHPNLVQLYGVSTRKRPLMIITEFMSHGSLHSYLKRHRNMLNKPGRLLDMCLQICKGMSYLERKNVIHRDLAARNCLVGQEGVIKVADFGLARFVLDDEYVSSNGTKFPVKWAPPEVLSYTKFSSKSDVWAFGVLMWEIFSGAEMPYDNMPNADVVDYVVNRGKRLKRPRDCPDSVYRVMLECWNKDADGRPAFINLEMKLLKLSDSGDYSS